MANILEYKCPCCGGAISFDSATQNMKCPFCDTEFDVDTLKGYDDDLQYDSISDSIDWNDVSSNEWNENEDSSIKIYVCDSCGGEILADVNTGATSCPFCGNPVVIKEVFKGHLKPDYVIPFKLDKKTAKEAYFSHIKGKKLLPKVFKDQNHIDEIKGIYVPFWLYDADVDASVRYKGTTVRYWSDKNYNYTETSYYSVIREGKIGFEHVPVDGSSKMEDDLMESVEPYNFNDAVDFQTAYLAGYLADKYDVEDTECVERANQRIRKSSEDRLAQTASGYATLVPEHSSINFKNGKRSYALYPVWILNTSFKGQNYRFAMNGQTGKMVGNLPIDKGLFWKWFFGIFAGVFAAVFALLYFLNL